jgi:hypothetical protein
VTARVRLSLVMLTAAALSCGATSEDPMWVESSSTATSCRSRLSDKICTLANDGSCGANNPEHVAQLLGLHDLLDSTLRAYLCKLDALIIDPTRTTAGLTEHLTQDNSTITRITVSPMIFGDPGPGGGRLTLSEYFSQKLGLAWAGDPTKAKATAAIAIPEVSNDFLVYTMVHELGHVVDYTRVINQWNRDCLKDQALGVEYHCSARGAFSTISWSHDDELKSRSPFGLLDVNRLAFGRVAWVPDYAVPFVLQELAGSGLVTLYGGSNASEDFAESVALAYLEAHFPRFTYTIDAPGRQTPFDLVEHFRGPRLDGKRSLLKRLSIGR